MVQVVDSINYLPYTDGSDSIKSNSLQSISIRAGDKSKGNEASMDE